MTGWRLGSLAVPGGLIKSFQRFMQHSVYCVPGFIQRAGEVALSLYDELVPQYRATFRTRQAFAAERLDAIVGISCVAPTAGFYVFPAVGPADSAVSARWLDALDVASVPGSAFGAAGGGHVRLSLSTSDADLAEAMDRIQHLVQQEGLPV
jgi:aspartate/methionine/tyrosine aminotransferase